MLDFKKLMDPEHQAAVRREIKAEEDRLEAERRADEEAVRICREHYEMLPERERSLVGSCHHALMTFRVLSEKQRAWLNDIAARLRKGRPATDPTA